MMTQLNAIARLLIVSLWLLSAAAYGQDESVDSAADTNEDTAPAATPAARAQFSSNTPTLLAQDLPQEQVMWLEVAGQKILSLYSPDHSGEARGGVILLPRHEQTITRHNRLFNLQQTLADNRWHALMLTMPPLTTDTAEQAQQTIAAAISFFNSKGIYNMVLLGEGSSANRLINYASQISDKTQLKQIRGLALVDAKNQINQQPITALLPKLKFPVLDIYFSGDRQAQLFAQQRLRSTKPLPRGQYQQVRMPRMGLRPQQDEDKLSKRIRGWLNKTAAGFSVGVK
ncbi:alpha/beta hydrolase family protein [Dasania sp. GY-MA-18]|uniref:Alpha/beta hydrolase family protein n=1 Tax=Dasania phycosphaerae TaxID=2950436 RepID=A0A9J6RK07_9GAMM|nr:MULTISPECIES: alpha/beta hydrolase family protein [Dasania]MCR8922310.1 alpha/beta hydrolase family protein [Dasania sp. GY-MA-18]MCZ0864738.1 alpha/beta hydrolase family protein [Dasania phycosphaerae]MCZ0868466.1 alpha/beta hydrolase family protein [Dasania phycosphaerae]